MVLSLMLGISFTEAKASKLTFKIANPDNGAKTVLSFTETGEKKEVKLPETEQSKSMTLPRNTSFCNMGVHGEHFIWILYKI